MFDAAKAAHLGLPRNPVTPPTRRVSTAGAGGGIESCPSQSLETLLAPINGVTSQPPTCKSLEVEVAGEWMQVLTGTWRFRGDGRVHVVTCKSLEVEVAGVAHLSRRDELLGKERQRQRDAD